MNSILILGRKQWVDALRALALILVLFGHTVHGYCGEYFLFTSPIKMPLFFAISGYLFKSRDNNELLFFKNVFVKLVIPWLCLSLIPAVVALPFEGWSFMLDYLYQLASGKRYWFMPCLILGEILFFYLLKYFANTSLRVLISICCLVIGISLSNNDILNFAMINRAIAVQPFFLLGHCLRVYEESFLPKIKWSLFLMIYLTIGVISMFVYPGKSLDIHLNYYYNYGFCFAMIVVGILFLFSGFKLIKDYPKWFIYVGQNTFVIYLWHGMTYSIFDFLFHYLPFKIDNRILLGSLKTIWALFICSVCAYYLTKYVPFIVGKKDKNLKMLYD